MKRDIGQELLDGIEAIKTGDGKRHAVEFPEAICDEGMIELARDNEGSITLEDFFNKHFPGQTEGAAYLRGVRTRENLSQTRLAELTGIPQRHISEMENGKRPIGKERAKLLAEALNADYRAFL